eukprot:TRINITY_DN2812_c0_g1_i1.p1 TRINITY_DN2812_c0_g1~~TRINITY_DN2812_c0_g1_i1.p1  ORF type:complete len:210 (+),score=37.60 TRINITY_DN2812_c0_g1_i1:157-786(+)
MTGREWDRTDESKDTKFYASPRFVYHIDDHFVETLKRFYLETFKADGSYLDIMSSWVSHYPEELSYKRVAGLGMNEDELKKNKQLTEWAIKDLNEENAKLDYEDESFDFVTNTVSVQYLINPVQIFTEVGRILKEGGMYICSFSNRMFPTKAVRIWMGSSENERVELVKGYYRSSKFFEEPKVFQYIDHYSHDPVYIVYARKIISKLRK